jgi:hypothetical protein
MLDPDQEGGSTAQLPPDNELLADLTVVTFEPTPQGIKALPKDKCCDILGRSTNKGDGVIMSWFEGPREATAALEWIENKQRNVRHPKVVMSAGRRPLTAPGRN